MKSIFKFIHLLLIFFILGNLLSQDKFSQFLSKTIDALGGRENIEKSNRYSYIVKVKRVVISSFDPPKYVEFTEYFKPPDKVRRDFKVKIPLKLGDKIIKAFHIFNGKEGWSNENALGKIFRYDMNDKEIVRISSKWTEIGLANRCLNAFKNINSLEEVIIEGRPYMKVRIKDKDPSKEHYIYIDKESFLPKIEEIFKKEKSWKTFFDNFQKVNNILIPFKVKKIYKSKNEYEDMDDIIVDLKLGIDVKIEEDKFNPPKFQ